jgi:hypothetical protein
VAELFADDETAPGEQVDRAYWETRTNPSSLGVVKDERTEWIQRL